jgi:putative RecB family exonuclease
MRVYSHSKLGTFEQCPLKYKFRYIDKIIPEIEKSIEAHLGDVVHSTLEWLYRQVYYGKIPPLDEVIIYYIKNWEEKYKPEIIIVKSDLTPKDYLNQGIQFLIDYYNINKPFDDNTLEVEKEIMINLDEQGKYKIWGFIDRLVHDIEKGIYEIHDYKTNNTAPEKDHPEKDRQLALYSIAIKEIYGRDKEVYLIWHYLAHNKKLVSKRTNEQLEQLKRDILELIKEIESTNIFPHNKSALCNWCRYKNFCPAWGGDPSKAKRYKFRKKD